MTFMSVVIRKPKKKEINKVTQIPTLFKVFNLLWKANIQSINKDIYFSSY